MRLRTTFLAVAAAGALLVGCTSGDSSSDSERTSGTEGSTPATVATGPAPGVTDDSIKVGVQWVDLESLGDIATLDHGDNWGAYQALFDDINANGGINGRTVDPVYAPINPVGTDGAEEACVQLTQDEQVFMVIGFFQADAMMCPLETHQTAVIGGQMSAERLARAQAP